MTLPGNDVLSFSLCADVPCGVVKTVNSCIRNTLDIFTGYGALNGSVAVKQDDGLKVSFQFKGVFSTYSTSIIIGMSIVESVLIWWGWAYWE